MYISHVAAGGLFLAFLALGLDGKPAPRSPQKSPSGNAAALGRELAELLAAASGPAAAVGAARSGGGGSKQPQQQQAPKGKGSPSGASASRLMRDLRTDTKQSRAAWARMAHPEHHAAAGGGGGGGGGSRRFKGLGKKGLSKGCFGLKLDRIGSMSGLGC